MEVLSDISSVSTHNSMPPLIDRFERIVMEDDQTTVTLPEVQHDPYMWGTHLFFDEEGNECSYEEYRRLHLVKEEESAEPVEAEPEEDEDELYIKTPCINQTFLLKHPRVILAFLRFIDFYNELAESDEVFMLRAIPMRIFNRILEHPAVKFVPEEFQEDVEELIQRLGRHADLSEQPRD
jgi:hypothetical protein